MKNLKKLIAILMVIALMIPCTAMAATESPSKAKLTSKNAKVTLTTSSYTYNGKTKSPSVKKVTYNGKTLKAGTDYTVKFTKHKTAGTYYVTVTGKGKYSGTLKAKYTIKKATQKKVKVTNK